MSKWRNESNYLGRYLGGGVINTLIGFAVIFSLMGFGASPFAANFSGYLVGLMLGFFISKKIVFRSQGHINREAMRYLAAFLVCWIMNIFVLQVALHLMQLNSYLAQIFGAVAYTVAMYLLSRWFVFGAKENSVPCSEQ